MSHRKNKSGKGSDKKVQNFCGSDIIEHKSTLSEQFFMDLLDLEQQFSTQQYTLAQVNKAIESYAKCVEYFDSINDPVKIYFMEKIQTTLVNQQTLKKLLSCQDTYIEQYDEEQLNTQNTQESFLTTNQQFTNNSFMETLTTEQDDFYFEEAAERKGLQKMQEQMKKRKLEAQKNPQNTKKQHVIRQRQMQMLMEVEKEYNNVEMRGVGGDNQSMVKAGTGQEIKNEIKNTATLIQETEHADQKQQELITEEMDKQETDIQERIRLRKQMREQKKKKLQEKQQTKEDINVFQNNNNNDSPHKRNKGSIDLTEEQQQLSQSQNDNSSQNNRSRQSSKANNEGKNIHVSDIFLDDKEELEKSRSRLKSQQLQQLEDLKNNNVGQEPIKEQNQEDEEDIEEQLQIFRKQIKQQYLKLPEDVKVKLRTASEMQDLDYRVLKSMHRCINDYEKKQKMSKSMTGPEITSLLAKNRTNFKKNKGTIDNANNQGKDDHIDEDNQAQYFVDGSTFSHSPFRNDKKSRRNLSCQLTSEFSNTQQQGLDSFAKNVAIDKNLEKVNIQESK